MALSAGGTVPVTSAWSGGVTAFGVSNKKLGMWLFLVSDSLTFGALLIASMYLRTASPSWPTPFPAWPSIAFASVMTLCLLTSSLTMVLAVAAAKRGDRSGAIRQILFTMAAGVLFIVLHANEWLRLIEEGVRPFSNPWGAPLFGATFFMLTGLHMLHVATGVIYLAVVAARAKKATELQESVEVCGLYWHFVDLVWMFIFPLNYLMSVSQ